MNIPNRDIKVYYLPRQDHEPFRYRIHHKPTGLDGIGEATTLEVAQVEARNDLEKKLRDREARPTERVLGGYRERGKPWPRAAS